MKGLNKYWLICSAFLLVAISPFAQTREELEKKRQQQEEEIAFTKELIQETTEKQKQTVNHLQVLNRQIEVREELINTIQQEIQSLQKDININQDIINSLKGDLKTLKEEYANMVTFTYKTRSKYDKLVFIFSSENFNQAFKRLRFLKYYSNFRQRQMEMINETRRSLQHKIEELESQQSEKRELLAQKKEEKNSLEQDLKEKSQVVEQLKNKEQNLRAKLEKKKEKAEELDKALEALIKKEMEAKEETGSKKYKNTPEAELISDQFENNKSNLPWPVKNGFISGQFGRQPHPTLDGVYVNNKGITITTQPDAKARAVFGGEVRRVVNQRGAGKAVLVRHGEYFTVYSNIAEVAVNPGEEIEAKEVIGRIKTDSESGQSELDFQVWKSYEKRNPANWIVSR